MALKVSLFIMVFFLSGESARANCALGPCYVHEIRVTECSSVTLKNGTQGKGVTGKLLKTTAAKCYPSDEKVWPSRELRKDFDLEKGFFSIGEPEECARLKGKTIKRYSAIECCDTGPQDGACESNAVKLRPIPKFLNLGKPDR